MRFLENCSSIEIEIEFEMEKVVNLGIPHVGENIFENIGTEELVQYFLVSQTWKVLAENVLLKRWKCKLFEACLSGKTKIVQLLLEHYKSEDIGLNARNEYEDTVFICACAKGYTDIAKLLLDFSDRNIELNARNNHGHTAFIFACSIGHTDIVKLLLEFSDRNIDVNAVSNLGRNAFMLACFKGRENVVKLLLDNSDISLNARANHGIQILR